LSVALSNEAVARVTRILMRRRRLIALAPRLAAADPVRLAEATGPEPRRGRPGPLFPEFPARAARVARWLRSVARSTLAVRLCRPRRTRCGRSRGPDNSRYP